MRMRKKHKLAERISACHAVMLGRLSAYEPSDCPGELTERLDFASIFGNNHPLHLEIGCGKGGFIRESARLFPRVNFLALEKSENVLVTAMERPEPPQNLRYIAGLAEYLERVLPPESVECIYLNFSCPYPKNSYAAHRLTHPRFLEIYRKLLTKNGVIRQKTDNRQLFTFSKYSYETSGYEIKTISEDLHKSGLEGNIMTEYEAFFSEKGAGIYYIEAKLKCS